MDITVFKLDGTSLQLPVTPEDNNKTVWQFLQEKLNFDGSRDHYMVKSDPASTEDVADQKISKFEGKKLIIAPKHAS